MKLLKTVSLFDYVKSNGDHPDWFREVERDIAVAVEAVKWPVESDKFILNPTKKGNGVVPIKKGFQNSLEREGWILEQPMTLVDGVRPGPIDAAKQMPAGLVAVEWETGNISSSHRAMNKLAIGISNGSLIGGILVLPSRSMYNFLTDRIGNFRELSPYFPLWRNLQLGRGFLQVVEVEHDGVSNEVPLIKKGTDGRALI